MTPMRCWMAPLILLPLLGCSGSSGGIPIAPSDGSAPRGAELAKSGLVREKQPALSDEDAQQFGSDNREFAFDLYSQLNDGENLFFSPFSISTALAMTYAGARTTTETEISRTMHFSLPQGALHVAFNATAQALLGRKSEQVATSEGMLAPASSQGTAFELDLADQAWGQKGYTFLSSYLDLLAKNYGAGLFLLNFADSEAARVSINDWVDEQTAHHVMSLLPPKSINSRTTLVLTNAVYFKASWLSKFDPTTTTDGTFHAAGGDRSVRMMNKVLAMQYGEGPGYQALELPYVSPSVRMLFLLPAQGEFDSFAQGMDAAQVDQVRSSLSEYSVTLALPKWSFASAHKLKAPLKALGMQQAFTTSADFSGMDGRPRHLFVDQVYHQAFVAVDEDGTEAEASTAVAIGRKSVSPSAQISFDRPFIFLVYDVPTGQILFLGQLVDPG